MQLTKKKYFQTDFLFKIIVVISLLITLVNLSSGMVFIGDQAWFYMSARDFLLGISFPLVGITSSHTWLHQGPLWTYLLSIALWIGNFNPLSGAYLSIIINTITILALYILSKKLFSKQVALITAALYAFSPYILNLSRMPYHTTPIPLLSLLYFYCLSSWVKGRTSHFPWLFFILALLYNFELATTILLGPVLFPMIYGFLNKKDFVEKLRKKDILKTIVLVLIPMVPIVIYDISHGFKQTFGYLAWLFYTVIKAGLGVIGILPSTGSLRDAAGFFLQRMSWLIFLPNFYIGVTIFLISIIGFGCTIYIKRQQKESISTHVLLIVWLGVSSLTFIFNKVPSDAYLPLLFPAVFFAIAVTLEQFMNIKIIVLSILLCIILNICTLLKYNYFPVNNGGILLSQRWQVVSGIISKSENTPFSLQGKGRGSQFESFLMPYEYLLWYKGHPVNNTADKIYSIEEKNSTIIVTQKK